MSECLYITCPIDRSSDLARSVNPCPDVACPGGFCPNVKNLSSLLSFFLTEHTHIFKFHLFGMFSIFQISWSWFRWEANLFILRTHFYTAYTCLINSSKISHFKIKSFKIIQIPYNFHFIEMYFHQEPSRTKQCFRLWNPI